MDLSSYPIIEAVCSQISGSGVDAGSESNIRMGYLLSNPAVRSNVLTITEITTHPCIGSRASCRTFGSQDAKSLNGNRGERALPFLRPFFGSYQGSHYGCNPYDKGDGKQFDALFDSCFSFEGSNH